MNDLVRRTPMGCGPQQMTYCPHRKTIGLGEANPAPAALTREEVKKYIMVGIITSIVGNLVTELIFRRFLFKGNQ